MPSPKVQPHDVEPFGTRQAREASFVFKTLGLDLDLRSSVVQVPTQLMHTIWFSLAMDRPLEHGPGDRAHHAAAASPRRPTSSPRR